MTKFTEIALAGIFGLCLLFFTYGWATMMWQDSSGIQHTGISFFGADPLFWFPFTGVMTLLFYIVTRSATVKEKFRALFQKKEEVTVAQLEDPEEQFEKFEMHPARTRLPETFTEKPRYFAYENIWVYTIETVLGRYYVLLNGLKGYEILPQIVFPSDFKQGGWSDIKDFLTKGRDRRVKDLLNIATSGQLEGVLKLAEISG